MDTENNPISAFDAWLAEASTKSEFSRFAYLTSVRDDRPHTSMVLLESFDENGFVFSVQTEGCAEEDITRNDHVAVALYWPAHRRQVRMEGRVERLNSNDAICPHSTQLSMSQEARSRYVLKPTYFEFYQFHENWINDRVAYQGSGDDASWVRTRLAA